MTTSTLPELSRSLISIPSSIVSFAVPKKKDVEKSIIEAVAEVLGVPINNSWFIADIDKKNGLALAHYDPRYDMNDYGHIRGTVVDYLDSTVVSKTYGYTPIIVRPQLIPSVDGVITLDIEQNTRYFFKPDRYKIYAGFEGSLMRVFMYNGKVYHTLYKQLNPTRYGWGKSKDFMTLFYELGGPSNDVLFDTTKKFSPWCFTFVISHKDLLVATKQDIRSDGYLVLLEVTKLWETLPNVPPEEIDEELRMNFEYVEEMPSVITKPFIYKPKPLTIEEANRHLSHGYHQSVVTFDNRLSMGEFVIMHRLDDAGNTIDLVKVVSPAYAWRTSMRNNDPDLYRNFCRLTNFTHQTTNLPEEIISFSEYIPLLSLVPISEVKDMLRTGPILTLPETNSSDPKYQQSMQNARGRLHNLWLAYILSLPLSRQKEVADYFETFIAGRDRLIKLIVALAMYDNFDKRDFTTTYTKRMLDIVEEVKRRYIKVIEESKIPLDLQGSRRYYKRPVFKGATAEERKKNEMQRHTYGIIMNENGSSIHKMVIAMNRARDSDTDFLEISEKEEKEREEKENEERLSEVKTSPTRKSPHFGKISPSFYERRKPKTFRRRI